jgi:hypothetical protein
VAFKCSALGCFMYLARTTRTPTEYDMYGLAPILNLL